MKRRVGCINYYIWLMEGWCFYPTKSPIRGGRMGRGTTGVPGLLPGQDPLPSCRGWGWWPELMALYLHTSNLVGTHTVFGGLALANSARRC